jgi:hypothetical protein
MVLTLLSTLTSVAGMACAQKYLALSTSDPGAWDKITAYKETAFPQGSSLAL